MANISEVVAGLRTLQSDTSNVEIKSAAGGLPTDIGATLSGLANTPGGGLLILGLNEKRGFTPVGLDKPQELLRAVSNYARDCRPPVHLSLAEIQDFETAQIVVAQIEECSASQKPCAAPNGKAYLRSFDSTYELSELEKGAFFAQRDSEAQDREPVLAASANDLDSELVKQWRRNIGTRDPLARFTGDEQLFRAGIIDESGHPTVAGLLSMGMYPQQHFPGLVIRAAVLSDSPGVRATHVKQISGSIPQMMDDAMNWAQEALPREIAQSSDGRVLDSSRFPLLAVRELISNALLHRDLSNWSQSTPIQIRAKTTGDLIITSPGGLYGITVDRLGKQGITSARNPVLLNLCRNLKTPSDARIIEGLATGIPTVNEELSNARLPPAIFRDSGLAFVAHLHGHPDAPIFRSASMTAVYEALRFGSKTAPQLAEQLNLGLPNTRRILSALRKDKHVVLQGGAGDKTSTYRLTPGTR